MRYTVVALLLLVAASQIISAQPPETFEVASVKPSRPGAIFSSTLDPAQFACSRNSLLMLIVSTYPEFPVWRISGGPAWLTREYWDVAAKLPPGMPTAEAPLNRRAERMLETLLADRFKLVIHREQRDLQVYALVPPKGGPNLKPSTGAPFSVKSGKGRLEFRNHSMDGLAAYLYIPGAPRQPAADHPVIDSTGLQGFFDFTLEWTSDTDQTDITVTGPSIFTARKEQLGLKLQPQKSPIEFLVIDHAERPADN